MSGSDDIFAAMEASILATFGEPITYQGASQPDAAITAAFIDTLDEPQSHGFLTVAEIKADSLSFTPGRGDVLVRGPDTYKVQEVVRQYGAYRLTLVRKP